jgi:hypothetical protein
MRYITRECIAIWIGDWFISFWVREIGNTGMVLAAPLGPAQEAGTPARAHYVGASHSCMHRRRPEGCPYVLWWRGGQVWKWMPKGWPGLVFFMETKPKTIQSMHSSSTAQLQLCRFISVGIPTGKLIFYFFCRYFTIFLSVFYRQGNFRF